MNQKKLITILVIAFSELWLQGSSFAQEGTLPKRLFISVSNGREAPSEVTAISANGVTFGSAQTSGSTLVYSTSRSSDRQIDTIAVDDGHTASFSSGVTIPLVQQSYFENAQFSARGRMNSPTTGTRGAFQAQGSDQSAGESYNYQNLQNGIFVKPEVVGSMVKLNIMMQNDQPLDNFSDPSHASYTTFKSLTTLTVPIGKWVYYGGNQQATFNNDGLSIHTRDASSEGKRDVWIRVDLISN